MGGGAEGSSSSDDCEEATRRLLAGMPKLNSSRSSGNSDHRRMSSLMAASSSAPSAGPSTRLGLSAVEQLPISRVGSSPEAALAAASASGGVGGTGARSIGGGGSGSSGALPLPAGLTAEEAEVLERRRQSRSNYHLSSGQAAVELFLRLNHARQTLDFAKRQVRRESDVPSLGTIGAFSACWGSASCWLPMRLVLVRLVQGSGGYLGAYSPHIRYPK